MRKLVIILIAFIAVVTFLRAAGTGGDRVGLSAPPAAAGSLP